MHFTVDSASDFLEIGSALFFYDSFFFFAVETYFRNVEQ